MPMVQPIPGYLKYPPTIGIYPQGYAYPQPDFNMQLPFLSKLDLPHLSQHTNDMIYHHPFMLGYSCKATKRYTNILPWSLPQPNISPLLLHRDYF